MVHRDSELPGRCLRQPSASVEVCVGGQLDLLRARSTHPPGQPLSCQVGLRGSESPGAGPDQDLGSQSAKLLDGDRDGVRTEQAPPLRRAALVGIEPGGHATIQWVRRCQLDATDDGQRQQHRTLGAGTDGDQAGQLVLGQHVKQPGGGDEACASQIARVQLGDVGLPCFDGDLGPVGSGAWGIGYADLEQVCVPVVPDPMLRPGQQRGEPAPHRPGAAAEVVDHPAGR